MRTTSFAIFCLALVAGASLASAQYASVAAALRKEKGYSLMQQVASKLKLESAINKNGGNVAVFVPSDAAFKALAAQFKVNPTALLNNPAYANLLRTVTNYHIAKPFTAQQRAKGVTVATNLAGNTLRIVKNKVYAKGSTANLIKGIRAGKTYVYLINHVLLPVKLSG